jgi:hypothetical protein
LFLVSLWTAPFSDAQGTASASLGGTLVDPVAGAECHNYAYQRTDPNSAIFVGSYSNPSNLDTTSVRIDHSFARISLFGRYHNSPSTVRPRNVSNPVVFDTNIQNSETALWEQLRCSRRARVTISAGELQLLLPKWQSQIGRSLIYARFGIMLPMAVLTYRGNFRRASSDRTLSAV